MGAISNENPLNHNRYTDAEAVSAMAPKSSSNSLNHDRYTDTECLSAVYNAGYVTGPHYTDEQSIAAMGPLSDSNSYNHIKYTNADAVAAMQAITNTINNRLDALEATSPTRSFGQNTISTNGLFCGFYSNLYSGSVSYGGEVGHRALKKICETSCSAQTAHVCTGSEISLSLQVGALQPSSFDILTGGDPVLDVRVWYDDLLSEVGNPNGTKNQCASWRSSASTLLGNCLARENWAFETVLKVTSCSWQCNGSLRFICCN